MEVTLISHFFDSRINGVGNHSKLILEGLKNTNLSLNTISQIDGTFTSNNALTYFYFTYFDLKHILNQKYKNSDVYHALTPLESIYINKRKGVTSILDLMPITNGNEENYFKYKISRIIFEKSLKEAIKCERIIVNNNDISFYLENNWGVDSSIIKVIGPPIDNNFYPKNEKHDKFVIGTLSGLGPRKRVDILIESFLKADIENSQLLIGGTGTDYNKLVQLSQNDERIEFLGFIPDNQVNDFYNSLDVFVFPTKFEGYGMPIVEAMACGKPVITLEDSIIPSIVKNKTFVTTKNNLANVLKNREYKCNIKDNLNFFREHSTEKIASKLIEVYDSI